MVNDTEKAGKLWVLPEASPGFAWLSSQDLVTGNLLLQKVT